MKKNSIIQLIVTISTLGLCLALLVGFTVNKFNNETKPQPSITALSSMPLSYNIENFLIGALRSDGILVPFAQYQNGNWLNPLATILKKKSMGEKVDKDITITHKDFTDTLIPQLKNGNILTNWYLQSSTDTPLQLEVSKFVEVENHCQANLGLLTNFPKSANLEDSTLPQEISGLALNINNKVRGFTKIQNDSVESKKIYSYLQPLLNKAEDSDNEIQLLQKKGSYYSSSSERAKIKIYPLDLYRSIDNIEGKDIYYFNTKKSYRKKDKSLDPSCKYISFFSGWVIKDKTGKLTLVNKNIIATDCNMVDVEFFLPLGLMEIKNHVFIFSQKFGYESEYYTIFELSGSKISEVLEIYAGGC